MTSETPSEEHRVAERSEREAALVRLLQRVAVAANEAVTIDEALQISLDEVCAYTGWPVGHAYLLDPKSDQLVPTGVWCLADQERFRRFRETTERTRLARGEGVPGRVLATGQPLWISDVSLDPAFIRGRQRGLGVRAGRTFPILAGRETVGALEFYSTEAAEPDPGLLEVMSQVGVQLGRVVERVRAEEALRISEAKFAGIMSISSDAIVSIDDEQRITFFNQGAEETFGYTADEALGQHLDLLIPERLREIHRRYVEDFAAGPIAARRMGERGQIRGLRKGGESFPADASISKLHVDGDSIFTAVLRDVTARVRVEQELQRSNAELEQFAYVASHDLQEPLRMVASYTQLLARRYGDKLDGDAKEFISFAVDGVTRMQALINDLLAFSRVGTRGGAFEEVAADAVLDRVLTTLGPSIQDAGAQIIREPLPIVQADPLQLGQVFQNLLSNAIKFRKPDSAPRVRISAEPENEEWVFAVTDEGIGIEAQYMDRIFILFQRLHTRADYPGTGIGLAICKKIVERHGGRIWLRSTPGEGSTFYFSLPAAARIESPDVEPTSAGAR
jgi:PAS domain S-box-containing protein